MATLTERLRMPTQEFRNLHNDAADEIDRLTAENAALREERDALAATIRELDVICTPVMRSYCAGSRLADYKAFIDRAHENGSAILAARDAQTRKSERDRCAKACDEMRDNTTMSQFATQTECRNVRNVFTNCAAAIRALED